MEKFNPKNLVSLVGAIAVRESLCDSGHCLSGLIMEPSVFTGRPPYGYMVEVQRRLVGLSLLFVDRARVMEAAGLSRQPNGYLELNVSPEAYDFDSNEYCFGGSVTGIPAEDGWHHVDDDGVWNNRLHSDVEFRQKADLPILPPPNTYESLADEWDLWMDNAFAAVKAMATVVPVADSYGGFTRCVFPFDAKCTGAPALFPGSDTWEDEEFRGTAVYSRSSVQSKTYGAECDPKAEACDGEPGVIGEDCYGGAPGCDVRVTSDEYTDDEALHPPIGDTGHMGYGRYDFRNASPSGSYTYGKLYCNNSGGSEGIAGEYKWRPYAHSYGSSPNGLFVPGGRMSMAVDESYHAYLSPSVVPGRYQEVNGYLYYDDYNYESVWSERRMGDGELADRGWSRMYDRQGNELREARCVCKGWRTVRPDVRIQGFAPHEGGDARYDVPDSVDHGAKYGGACDWMFSVVPGRLSAVMSAPGRSTIFNGHAPSDSVSMSVTGSGDAWSLHADCNCRYEEYTSGLSGSDVLDRGLRVGLNGLPYPSFPLPGMPASGTIGVHPDLLCDVYHCKAYSCMGTPFNTREVKVTSGNVPVRFRDTTKTCRLDDIQEIRRSTEVGMVTAVMLYDADFPDP